MCRLVDPDATIVGYHEGHNHTKALRAATRIGEIIVKVHRSPERHDQEVHAYRHWTTHLADRAPRLLAASSTPPAIAVTAVPGQPLAKVTLSTAAERDAYRQAGTLLRTYHAAGPPRWQPDIVRWLADRGEAWVAVARDSLSIVEHRALLAHLRDLRDLPLVPAVPCHLDFTPGNLVRADDNAIRLIDYEHSRHDLASRDLVRLATRTWRHRPDLADAFQQGYGRLTDLDCHVIDHWAPIDRLTQSARARGLPAPP